MSYPIISVEHLSKQYDLGVVGTGSLVRDFERWWARVRKQPDPYSRIGQKDAFRRRGETILALDDVSFTVHQGEALGIIGKNGAGKSTLLKILSRVTAPTSGVVKVKGRIGSLLEVGTGFHPELTGRENIYLNGAILGMKKAEVTRKFDEIVDFSGVEKFIDTPVKRYSSGMYVRLAFAVAAHLDPEILIVDEVLAVGDAEFQKKCLGKMGDVTGEGRTVVFVSHNMEAVKTLCPSVMLINEGHIQLSGDSNSVISKYLDEKASGSYIGDTSLQGSLHTTRLWFSDLNGLKKEKFKNGEPVVVNAEIENPLSQTIEFEMSFWDKKGNKLWNFTHYQHDIPPISGKPLINLKITFFVPILHFREIFMHAGIHVSGQEGPRYVEDIKEGLRYLIEETEEGIYQKDSALFTCPVKFEVNDIG